MKMQFWVFLITYLSSDFDLISNPDFCDFAVLCRWSCCEGGSFTTTTRLESWPKVKRKNSLRVLRILVSQNICHLWKNYGHFRSIFQRPRRLNQAMKSQTTKAKKLLNLILSSYLRTLTHRRYRSVRILFLVSTYLLNKVLT